MADVDDSTIIFTFKHKLKPTRAQHDALASICEAQRQLYNGCLEHRIGAFRKAGRSVTLHDQMKELTELRKEPVFATLPLALQRWTLRRLDDAYKAFFRRLKANGKAGFPRFRRHARWASFGFSEWKGITLRDGRIRFRGLPGSLRLHQHRPPPEGKPLGCTFTRDAKGWTACLQYRIPVQPLPKTGKQIGIDLGLTTLAMLSTGEAIANPRHTRRWERELRRRQRALARCKRGSNRRKKAKARVARLHAKVKACRRAYLHQVSARLVRDYDLIAVERLNVKGLARSIVAKGVNDAGWAMLKEMLAYKVAYTGRQLVEVDCRNTSRTCPECGQVKAKTLSERTHRCGCGCVLDRDHAAALVILQRGRSGSRATPIRAAA